MQVLLYTKKVKIKQVNEKGEITRKEFPTFLIKYKDKLTLDAVVSNDLKPRLEKDMAKNDLVYPIIVELDQLQCFIAKERYERKDGTKGIKDKFVLTDYNTISQGEFPPQTTLDDIVAEKEARAKEMEQKAGVVEENDLPF